MHDVDIHLTEIKKFINQLSLDLVHVHANNYAPIRADDDLPIVLELTFLNTLMFQQNINYRTSETCRTTKTVQIMKFLLMNNLCF